MKFKNEFWKTFDTSELEIISNALRKYHEYYTAADIERKSLTIEVINSHMKTCNKILHLAQLFESVVSLIKDDEDWINIE